MLDWFKSNILFISVIACLLCVIMIKDCNHNKKLRTLTRIDTAFKPVMHYTDSKGDSHAQIPVQVVEDKKVFKQATNGLKKEIKGADKIIYVTKYEYCIDTVFEILDGYTSDSLDSFNYQDNYIYVKSLYDRFYNKGFIKLKSIDTLTHTTIIDKHFLKANDIIVDIKNKSPYTKVNSGYSFMLKESKPILSLAVVAAFNPIQMKPVWGIGVALPLISIKSRK